MPIFGVSLVGIFPHLDWIRRDTPYLSVFSRNARKYRPESKLWRKNTMNEILNISIKNIWVRPEKRVICRPDLLISRPVRKQFSWNIISQDFNLLLSQILWKIYYELNSEFVFKFFRAGQKHIYNLQARSANLKTI